VVGIGWPAGGEPASPRRVESPRHGYRRPLFRLVREMKNPYNHRLRLVESVKERGIKPTARLFATTVSTVRKWWRRYQRQGPSGLPDLAAVGAVCAAVSKPLNFMVGIKGKSFSVSELAAVGVRRISLATSLYRSA
jgi:hypothetical protein